MFQKTSNYTVYTVGADQALDYRIELGKSVSQIASGEQDIMYKQNATFAFIDKGIYRPIGYVVKDGDLIQTTTSASKWSAFVIPKNGRPYIGEIDPQNASEIKLAFQGTPQLVKNGQVFINSKYEGTPLDVLSSTKRSAIGVKSDGAILMVTTFVPYSLNDLAKLMITLGCIEALNLDGGGSTTRNYMNEKVTQTERPVSAAIVVKQNKQVGDDSMTTPILIIDAGHGGSDPGAVGSNGIKEKDLTLQISLYQYARFQQLGVPVALTRNKDETLDSSPRTKRVKDSGAKYCISNHINAGGGIGVETIHSIYSDGKLAKKFYDVIVSSGQTGRRVFTRTLPDNIKKDYYYMHRDTGSADTTIIEYGFIDNNDDIKNIQKNWRVYAEAVVKAFCEHKGLSYSPPAQANSDLESALKVILAKGAIQTPDYWINNAVKGGLTNGEYTAILIKNVASVITSMDKEISILKSNQESIQNPPTTTNPKPKPDPAKPSTPQPEEKPKSWDEVLKMALDTSVYFQVNLKNGTGVLLKDGYVLTAKHVVSPNVQMEVQTYDRSWWDIDLISMHPECDIALCKIKRYRSTLPYLSITSKGIKSDQKVISVGHGSNNKWRTKEGVICREQVPTQLWEFDCSLPLTNDDSGSAVVNEYGEIVGIVVDSVPSVGVKRGSIRESVPGAEAINLNHSKITSWLKDLKIIQ